MEAKTTYWRLLEMNDSGSWEVINAYDSYEDALWDLYEIQGQDPNGTYDISEANQCK